MSEYLSKEEIKQWRSSLEKITLEEFAARLGKKIEGNKPTNDIVDIVLHGQPFVSEEKNWSNTQAERLSAIADRAYEKEKELYVSPFSAKNLKIDAPKKEKVSKTSKTKISDKKETKQTKKASEKPAAKKQTLAKKLEKALTKAAKRTVSKPAKTADKKLKQEVQIVLKKSLTDREQKVFDYFTSHKNEIVYAKDLASLLELPRDYVYKYIKNLRNKIEGDLLKNADKGGFMLSI